MSAESEGLMDSTNATSNATTNLQSAINSLSSIIQSMNNILSTYQANISKLASATNAFASATQQQTSVLRENEDQTGNNQDANSSLNSTLNTVSATGVGLTGVYNAINNAVLVATDIANGFARQQLSVWAANIQVIGSTNTLVQAQAMAALAQSQGGAAAQNAAAQNLGYAQTQLKVSQQNVTLAQTAQTTAGLGDVGLLLSSIGNAAQGILAAYGAMQLLNTALGVGNAETASLSTLMAGLGEESAVDATAFGAFGIAINGVEFAGLGLASTFSALTFVPALAVLIGSEFGILAGLIDLTAVQGMSFGNAIAFMNTQIAKIPLFGQFLAPVSVLLGGLLIDINNVGTALGTWLSQFPAIDAAFEALKAIVDTIVSPLTAIESVLGGGTKGATGSSATASAIAGISPTQAGSSSALNTITSDVNSLISWLTHAASGLTIASIIPKAQLGGTITSGGLINVHAGEVISPAGGATGATSLGGVTININVNTQADLAALSSNVTKGISRAMQNATLGKGAYS